MRKRTRRPGVVIAANWATSRDGSDRCKVGFRTGWHGQEGPEREYKEGNEVTLCLGAS